MSARPVIAWTEETTCKECSGPMVQDRRRPWGLICSRHQVPYRMVKRSRFNQLVGELASEMRRAS